MPNHGLESFGMRRYGIRIERRNYHRRIRDLRGMSAVAAQDSDDFRSDLLGVANGGNQIRADLLFDVAPAYG